jgi:hypothetical protein
MNDDVTTCPNCLKDMSSLKPMPEVNLTSKKKESNRFIYGGVLTLGGILASLSQGINKKGYQVKYDEILKVLETVSDAKEKENLTNKALEYLNLISNCQFREIFFLAVAGIGVILIIVTLVLMIKNKSLKKKEK